MEVECSHSGPSIDKGYFFIEYTANIYSIAHFAQNLYLYVLCTVADEWSWVTDLLSLWLY